MLKKQEKEQKMRKSYKILLVVVAVMSMVVCAGCLNIGTKSNTNTPESSESK